MTPDSFLPDEHQLLRAWFNRSRITPKIDQILLDSGFDQYCEPYTRLSAAIGAIVVRDIQPQLPNFGVGLPDGGIALARKIRPTPAQSARLTPQHLFTVNWADTAPGISWPVAYHACWLPAFGRFVVTSSADSPEAFGYCDFALGHFGLNDDWRQSVRAILVADWREQSEKCSQGPWGYVFEAGVLSADMANAWKEEVWSEPCKAGSLGDAVLAFAAARAGRDHLSGGNAGIDAIPPKPKDDPLFRRVFVVGLSFPRR
jgi:hypothetical protein